MGKGKRQLSAQEKAAKKERREKFMTIFVNGKQESVRCPPMIDGMGAQEFFRQNADPLWLHQNEMWEYIEGDDDLDLPESEEIDF